MLGKNKSDTTDNYYIILILSNKEEDDAKSDSALNVAEHY